ncbi:MAG: butyrate kinase [Deltaproteobacteria bacterium]|nr:butyrate kinase [Candidatus Anaeroferrophillacea bacterium]
MIFALNVGSTTVKLGRGNVARHQTHTAALPARCRNLSTLTDNFRPAVDDLVEKMERLPWWQEVDFPRLRIIVSRGGMQCPGPAGAYRIDDPMLSDLATGRYGWHPCSLGPALALHLGRRLGIEAYAVDPPTVDEFAPVARYSGLPDLPRTSAFHALSHKAVARRAAHDLGRAYETCRLVVAHLGGGITVAAHDHGRAVDATHGLDEGPLTPERAGSLPVLPALEWIAEQGCSVSLARPRLIGSGGLQAYLGTKDGREVERRIAAGDPDAAAALAAMAYQIAKDIGAMATVLEGNVDAVVLTGGLIHSARLMELLTPRISFIAPVMVYGENETDALMRTADKILNGEMTPHDYS